VQCLDHFAAVDPAVHVISFVIIIIIINIYKYVYRVYVYTYTRPAARRSQYYKHNVYRRVVICLAVWVNIYAYNILYIYICILYTHAQSLSYFPSISYITRCVKKNVPHSFRNSDTIYYIIINTYDGDGRRRKTF